MSFFGGNGDDTGAFGMALMLGEVREIRQTMDKYDQRLRDDISGLREIVNQLSNAVSRSQTTTDTVQKEVAAVKKELDEVKTDVAFLKEAQTKRDSSWSGPKKLLIGAGLILTALGGTIAVISGWPVLLSLLL